MFGEISPAVDGVTVRDTFIVFVADDRVDVTPIGNAFVVVDFGNIIVVVIVVVSAGNFDVVVAAAVVFVAVDVVVVVVVTENQRQNKILHREETYAE